MARAWTQRQQIAAALVRQLTTAQQARTLRRTTSNSGGRKEGEPDVATVIIPQAEAEAATASLLDAVASPSPEPEPPAQPDWAILHNEHDVGVYQAECQALVNSMTQMGAQANMPMLQLAARAYATMRLLVLKGVCTEAETQGEEFLALRAILREQLLAVEADVAKRTGKSVQAVHTPKIVVARR